MNYSSNYSPRRGFPAGNPIANALVIVVGALVIGASIILGFFAFVLLASVLIVLSAIVGLRVWWFNRKLDKSAARQGGKKPAPGESIIEGEYRIVRRQEDRLP